MSTSNIFNPFNTEEETNTGFNFEEGPVGSTDNPFDMPSSVIAPTITPPNNPPLNPLTNPTYTKKYNIVDLYWLVNQKLFNKEKLEKGEVSLLVLGYNADFNNLRIAFHEATNKSFTETSILKYETKQLTTVNLFSETSQKILYNIQAKKFKDEFANFERIFTPHSSNNEWKPNITQIEMDIPNSIIIKTKHGNNIYSFTFIDWQIQAFLNAMKFMTDGNAWRASLSINN